MIKFIAGLTLTLTLLASPSSAAITVPNGAVQVDGDPIGECPDGTLVLKYTYATPDGHTLFVLKEPNKEIRLMLEYTGLPGEDGELVKVWDISGEITKEELHQRYQGPCDLFKKA